jgi:hypothetical protein
MPMKNDLFLFFNKIRTQWNSLNWAVIIMIHMTVSFQ